jgi:hypothetical protein
MVAPNALRSRPRDSLDNRGGKTNESFFFFLNRAARLIHKIFNAPIEPQ